MRPIGFVFIFQILLYLSPTNSVLPEDVTYNLRDIDQECFDEGSQFWGSFWLFETDNSSAEGQIYFEMYPQNIYFQTTFPSRYWLGVSWSEDCQDCVIKHTNEYKTICKESCLSDTSFLVIGRHDLSTQSGWGIIDVDASHDDATSNWTLDNLKNTPPSYYDDEIDFTNVNFFVPPEFDHFTSDNTWATFQRLYKPHASNADDWSRMYTIEQDTPSTPTCITYISSKGTNEHSSLSAKYTQTPEIIEYWDVVCVNVTEYCLPPTPAPTWEYIPPLDIDPYCEGKNLELVLFLDTSWSILEDVSTSWEYAKTFSASVLNLAYEVVHDTLDDGYTLKVAFITFSSDAELIYNLNEFGDDGIVTHDHLVDAQEMILEVELPDIIFRDQMQGTHARDAIQMYLDQVSPLTEPRESGLCLIMITDGRPDDPLLQSPCLSPSLGGPVKRDGAIFTLLTVGDMDDLSFFRCLMHDPTQQAIEVDHAEDLFEIEPLIQNKLYSLVCSITNAMCDYPLYSADFNQLEPIFPAQNMTIFDPTVNDPILIDEIEYEFTIRDINSTTRTTDTYNGFVWITDITVTLYNLYACSSDILLSAYVYSHDLDFAVISNVTRIDMQTIENGRTVFNISFPVIDADTGSEHQMNAKNTYRFGIKIDGLEHCQMPGHDKDDYMIKMPCAQYPNAPPFGQQQEQFSSWYYFDNVTVYYGNEDDDADPDPSLCVPLVQLCLIEPLVLQSMGPTTQPTPEPTPKPSRHPTRDPTTQPSDEPTALPSSEPSSDPSTIIPTDAPTEGPTFSPSSEPTIIPLFPPSFEPTSDPTTIVPTDAPTEGPTFSPSSDPTSIPTEYPTFTAHPSYDPTTDPTQQPLQPGDTREPTDNPTASPSTVPTADPTEYPTVHPTDNPTLIPIVETTVDPTEDPTYTTHPTQQPSVDPTQQPLEPGKTRSPTLDPTRSPTINPTTIPTVDPTVMPSEVPTNDPTELPTDVPTNHPSYHPSENPTRFPTVYPTRDPLPPGETREPTMNPTDFPTTDFTEDPTSNPTAFPTFIPSGLPIEDRTIIPSVDPTQEPTENPSPVPTRKPFVSGPTRSPVPTEETTLYPTEDPTSYPTDFPTFIPSALPIEDGTFIPSVDPTSDPSFHPTEDPIYVMTTPDPTQDPTVVPSFFPTEDPVRVVTENPTKAPLTECQPYAVTPPDPAKCPLLCDYADTEWNFIFSNWTVDSFIDQDGTAQYTTIYTYQLSTHCLDNIHECIAYNQSTFVIDRGYPIATKYVELFQYQDPCCYKFDMDIIAYASHPYEVIYHELEDRTSWRFWVRVQPCHTEFIQITFDSFVPPFVDFDGDGTPDQDNYGTFKISGKDNRCVWNNGIILPYPCQNEEDDTSWPTPKPTKKPPWWKPHPLPKPTRSSGWNTHNDHDMHMPDEGMDLKEMTHVCPIPQPMPDPWHCHRECLDIRSTEWNVELSGIVQNMEDGSSEWTYRVQISGLYLPDHYNHWCGYYGDLAGSFGPQLAEINKFYIGASACCDVPDVAIADATSFTLSHPPIDRIEHGWIWEDLRINEHHFAEFTLVFPHNIYAPIHGEFWILSEDESRCVHGGTLIPDFCRFSQHYTLSGMLDLIVVNDEEYEYYVHEEVGHDPCDELMSYFDDDPNVLKCTSIPHGNGRRRLTSDGEEQHVISFNFTLIFNNDTVLGDGVKRIQNDMRNDYANFEAIFKQSFKKKSNLTVVSVEVVELTYDNSDDTVDGRVRNDVIKGMVVKFMVSIALIALVWFVVLVLRRNNSNNVDCQEEMQVTEGEIDNTNELHFAKQ
eukprot:1851_1